MERGLQSAKIESRTKLHKQTPPTTQISYGLPFSGSEGGTSKKRQILIGLYS
jgi:hypothetical protein